MSFSYVPLFWVSWYLFLAYQNIPTDRAGIIFYFAKLKVVVLIVIMPNVIQLYVTMLSDVVVPFWFYQNITFVMLNVIMFIVMMMIVLM
jgi:hypothetical protein